LPGTIATYRRLATLGRRLRLILDPRENFDPGSLRDQIIRPRGGKIVRVDDAWRQSIAKITAIGADDAPKKNDSADPNLPPPLRTIADLQIDGHAFSIDRFPLRLLATRIGGGVVFLQMMSYRTRRSRSHFRLDESLEKAEWDKIIDTSLRLATLATLEEELDDAYEAALAENYAPDDPRDVGGLFDFFDVAD